MTIRDATLDDLPALLELAEQFHHTTIYASLVRWAPATVEALIRSVLQVGVILVAEDAGELVGMLGFVVLPHLVSGELFADEQAWFVRPDKRQGSVGPKLLRSCAKRARQMGARMVKVSAPAGSTVGRFYERLGFAEVETVYLANLPP